MPKQKKEFPNFPFDELVQAVDKTLSALKSSEWKIKKRGREGGIMRWTTEVSTPWHSFYDWLSRATYKVLMIEVTSNKVSVECKEYMPFYVIDWMGEKKRILQEFFLHLESMLSSGVLHKKVIKRYNYIEKLFYEWPIVIVIGIIITIILTLLLR